MQGYESAAVFLFCILAAILFLPCLYFCATKYVENQSKTILEYLSVRTEESDDEYIPPTAKPALEFEEEDEEEERQNVFEQFLKSIQQFRGRESTSQDIAFNPAMISTELLVKKENLEDSAHRAQLGLKFHYEKHRQFLSIQITSVRNIVRQESGGPQKIKFVLKLYNHKNAKEAYKKKFSTSYIKVSDYKQLPFGFRNISREVLLASMLRIRMFGLNGKTFSNEELQLGAIYVRLEDVYVGTEDCVQIVKSLFPEGEELY